MRAFLLLLLLTLSIVLVHTKTYPNRYLEEDDEEEESLLPTKKARVRATDKVFPPVSISNVKRFRKQHSCHPNKGKLVITQCYHIHHVEEPTEAQCIL